MKRIRRRMRAVPFSKKQVRPQVTITNKESATLGDSLLSHFPSSECNRGTSLQTAILLLAPAMKLRKVPPMLGGMGTGDVVGPIILLIENEEHDVFLFRRALGKLDFRGVVRVVTAVTQARNYVLGNAEFANREYYPFPDLIISDLKMEGETGLEFLRWLRAHEKFHAIPVYMFSGSGLPSDEKRALELGARKYFTKSGDFNVALRRIDELLRHAEIIRAIPPKD